MTRPKRNSAAIREGLLRGVKQCGRCKEEKPVSCFGSHKKFTGGLRWDCKKCNTAERKRYVDANKDRVLANARARRNTPEGRRATYASELRCQYGVSMAQYEAMLHQQGYRCAICSAHSLVIGKLALDHCHATKKVRGLLCGHCNRALGLFRDTLAIVERAAEYLRRHK